MHKLTGATAAILTEGMGGRMKTKGGQLAPLKGRLTPHQQARRTEKRAARQEIAARLVKRQETFMGGVVKTLEGFFARSFWGRMKWLLVGK